MSLNKDNADRVARQLVMAGSLMDDNPELAYEHAKAAYRRAARIDIVREALGLTAYANEKYGEALRELRTYRRMSGDISHAYLEADCERGMGKPERAIKYLEDINIQELEPSAQIELALVISGAYADLDQSELGLKLIESLKVDTFSDEMRVPVELVRVERLKELGRADEAAEIEAKWAPFWESETIEVYDEPVPAEDTDDTDPEFFDNEWEDEDDLEQLESPQTEEELEDDIDVLKDGESDRFADLRRPTQVSVEDGTSDDEVLSDVEDDAMNEEDNMERSNGLNADGQDRDIHDLETVGEDDLDEVRAGYASPYDADGDPEVDPDDFIDDAEPDDFVDQGDLPVNLDDEAAGHGVAAPMDADITALDTGERDPELEAELDRVDDEVGAKIEEDEEDR
ncbi:hypothetical protein [Flaviflexus huanghaiensis]|uniref:hypothetical protein n=1 Tax=Flaviflexus huanghaiensis TaxID=1111473 RepID=UPI0015FAE1D4|nr:hypothetical protein [Flaviflexus huanghaiensis]